MNDNPYDAIELWGEVDIPGAFATYKSLLAQCNIPHVNTLGMAICLQHQHDMVQLALPYADYRVWSRNLNMQKYMGFYIIEAESPGECFLCQQGKGTHDPQ
jgi:hypothetical protein